MTFIDLPQDLNELSLEDPTDSGDVIDLMTSLASRHRGCLTVLLCDDAGRLVQPLTIDEVPENLSGSDMGLFLDRILPLVAEVEGSVVVARGRPDGPFGTVPTDQDRELHRAAVEACNRHGVWLLNFHVATRQGVLHLPDAQAEAV